MNALQRKIANGEAGRDSEGTVHETYKPVLSRCSWCEYEGPLDDELYVRGNEIFCGEDCEQKWDREESEELNGNRHSN